MSRAGAARAWWPVLRIAWRAHPRAFATGLALLAITQLAGIALLGLSAWFITAAAIAGAASAGLAFDVFAPSAFIRLLAFVRTGGRYGERLITHDATLRFLARLRVSLFHGFARRPFAQLAAMRSAIALNRVTGDVDALDAIYLRIVAPLVTGAISILAAFVLLWTLVDPWIALWVVGWVAGAAAIVLAAGIGAAAPAVRRHALALDAVRLRLIDLARGTTEFATSGRLADQAAAVRSAGDFGARALARLDRIERVVAVSTPMVTMFAAAGALWLGPGLALSAPRIAIAVFVALALNELLQPLRRAILDITRSRMAAARVSPLLRDEPTTAGVPERRASVWRRARSEPSTSVGPPSSPDRSRALAGASSAEPSQAHTLLTIADLRYRHAAGRAPVLDGFSMELRAGEWLALTGPSGAGKSTVLLLAAGLIAPETGHVRWAAGCRYAVLPQRSQLFAGSIAQNLRLAAPQADDDRLWWALRGAALERVIAARGGLESVLGDGGSGLSGGEARRLAIARLLLRDADVLLLDEPTTGLDAGTAAALLAGLRGALAGRSVLAASHLSAEVMAADRRVTIG
ncbi:MAG: ATP-binding cassette domain-containing protein [Burkholderiaceae bacterium]